jgi:hypothetical protein
VTSLTTRAEQSAARFLRAGITLARGRLPTRRGPLAPVLKALSTSASRVAAGLEGSERRELETRLRAALEVDPGNDQTRHELALTLAAQGRNEEAVDAWIRLAERGAQLERVTLTLHTRRLVRDIAGSQANVRRMRRIAVSNPDSAQIQLGIGAFLVDHGYLEEGRVTVRRGYDLLLRDALPSPRPLPSQPAESLQPSFLILGPHKTATSSLYAMLVQHPRVIPAPRKELQFWGTIEGRPPEAYDAYFPALDRSAGFITGEASPSYLPLQEAAADVAARFPETKVIVMRRDPVARAFSHFQMLNRLQFERRGFDEAIDLEIRRIGPTPPLRRDDVPDLHAPYLLGSCILPHLRMWVDAVGPERVMVIDSAHFANDRQGTLDALATYLGLEPAPLRDETDRNVGQYSAISPDSEARLREWLAPHEAALDEFLATHAARIPGPAEGRRLS